MQITLDEPFGISPHRYMQFRPAMAAFPPIFNVSGACVVGNGSGYGEDAVDSAYGEYIERFHFYNEVTIDITANLQQVNAPSLNEKLFFLMSQTRQINIEPNTHAFDLTRVENIFTQAPSYLPTVMISLAAADSPDRKFIPFIDSCGQAVHADRERAFLASLKEFIERQALVGAWLSGRATATIDLMPHPLLLSSNKIISLLQEHGTLYVYDLGNHLPGYSVIIFYFAHSLRDCVQYSVGMAADFLPEAAIARAINELWQSYTFMYLNADNPEQLDQRYQYLNALLNFNSSATRDIIPFIQQSSINLSMSDYLSAKRFSEKECLKKLRIISPDIFAYQTINYFFGKKFFFCKILSADFFLHMGIKMPLNLQNSYAKMLSLPANLSLENAIPFP
jgi:hypothetical protein